MDSAIDVAYDLVGPGSVPWWAWAAIVLLIIAKVLAPMFRDEPPPGQRKLPPGKAHLQATYDRYVADYGDFPPGGPRH
jgi:hypothetical protein